ncbi:hypothetical protein [Effusibacillus lacus]|uniref:hypothetical protein n=1 Tax=Effusibacillus lacus TaxID=1348429 RepID=UPI000BB8F87E|nr:hypothetical protein [Effusibacillus lacus]
MSKSKAKRSRLKKVREGSLDPTLHRNVWNRKPQTQIVNNRKAEERRSFCRKKHEDGALYFAM